MTLFIRPAAPQDAGEIQAIYAPIVKDTAVSFETEPPDPDDPVLHLDNVILSAHALNWTVELDDALGRANVEAARSLLAGEVPAGLVNQSIAQDPRFLTKLRGLALISQSSRPVPEPTFTEGNDL